MERPAIWQSAGSVHQQIHLLLREYGLQAAEIKQVEEKMKGWKGYYFPTANARSVAGELGLARELRSTCWA